MLEFSKFIRPSLRHSLLITTIMLGLVAAMAVSVPAASAVSYHHITDYNGKCLDMTNASRSDGTQPQIWSCNNRTRQYWTLRSVIAPNGTDALLIENQNSHKCLSIRDNSPRPGAAVIQYGCKTDGSDYWEDWQQDCATGLSNYCYWVNVGMAGGGQGPNLCCAMHPSGNGSSDGLKIYANIPHGYRAYLWTHTVVG